MEVDHVSMLPGRRVALAPHCNGQLSLLNLIGSHRMAICSLFRSALVRLSNPIRSHDGSKARPKTFTETARPLVTTTRALSKHGCPLLSLLCSPTFRSMPMRAICAWAGSLILLAKFGSDSANSHPVCQIRRHCWHCNAQALFVWSSVLAFDQEYVVQDPGEACGGDNAEQASDGLEIENNDVVRMGVMSVQYSCFENVDWTSE